MWRHSALSVLFTSGGVSVVGPPMLSEVGPFVQMTFILDTHTQTCTHRGADARDKLNQEEWALKTFWICGFFFFPLFI